MAAKSAIDQFAASIIVKVSFYLTACLGVLLAILILFRQLEGIGATGPTLAEELLTLLVTLGLT